MPMRSEEAILRLIVRGETANLQSFNAIGKYFNEWDAAQKKMASQSAIAAAREQQNLQRAERDFQLSQTKKLSVFEDAKRKEEAAEQMSANRIYTMQQAMTRQRLALHQQEQGNRVQAAERTRLALQQNEDKINRYLEQSQQKNTRLATDSAKARIMASDAETAALQRLNQQHQQLYRATMADASGNIRSGAGALLGMAGIAGFGLGAAGVGTAGFLASQAMGAQTFMFRAQTNSFLSANQARALQNQAFALSTQNGVPWQNIVTAGRYGSDIGIPFGLNQQAVRSATQLGAITGSNPQDVMAALGTSWMNFPSLRSNPQNLANMIWAAARSGRVSDLNAFIQPIAPVLQVAGHYGDSQAVQSMAAIAALTGGGMTPEEAATQVKNLYSRIPTTMIRGGRPAKFLDWLAQDKGIDLRSDFTGAGFKQRGLGGVISDINRANLTPDALTMLFPNLRGYFGALGLTGNYYQRYGQVVQNIQGAQQQNGVGQYYKEYLNLDSTKAKALQQEFEKLSITLGTALLPGINQLEKSLIPLAQDFSAWTNQHKNLIPLIAEVSAGLLATTVAVKGLSTAVGVARTANDAFYKIADGLITRYGTDVPKALTAAKTGASDLSAEMTNLQGGMGNTAAKAGEAETALAGATAAGDAGLAAGAGKAKSEVSGLATAVNTEMVPAMTTARTEAEITIGTEGTLAAGAGGALAGTAGTGLLGIAGALSVIAATAAIALPLIASVEAIRNEKGPPNSRGSTRTVGGIRAGVPEPPGWSPGATDYADPTQIITAGGGNRTDPTAAIAAGVAVQMPKGAYPSASIFGVAGGSYARGDAWGSIGQYDQRGLSAMGGGKLSGDYDWGASLGSPITLPGGGQFTYIGNNAKMGAWGNLLYFRTPNGGVIALPHVANMPKLQVGQNYSGKYVGQVGNPWGGTNMTRSTGYWTGPHLAIIPDQSAANYVYGLTGGVGFMGVQGGNTAPSQLPPGIAKWWPQIMAASQATGVPPGVIAAYMSGESSGVANANSGLAYGLMQLTPGTAKAMGVNALDPAQNVLGGAKLIAQGMQQYGQDWNAIYTHLYNPGVKASDGGYQTILANLKKWATLGSPQGPPVSPAGFNAKSLSWSQRASAMSTVITDQFGSGNLENLKGPSRTTANQEIDTMFWEQAHASIQDIMNNPDLSPALKQAGVKQVWAMYWSKHKDPLGSYMDQKHKSQSPQMTRLNNRVSTDNANIGLIDDKWSGLDIAKLPSSGNGGVNQQAWLKDQYKRDKLERDMRDSEAEKKLWLGKISRSTEKQLLAIDKYRMDRENQDARAKLAQHTNNLALGRINTGLQIDQCKINNHHAAKQVQAQHQTNKHLTQANQYLKIMASAMTMVAQHHNGNGNYGPPPKGHGGSSPHANTVTPQDINIGGVWVAATPGY